MSLGSLMKAGGLSIFQQLTAYRQSVRLLLLVSLLTAVACTRGAAAQAPLVLDPARPADLLSAHAGVLAGWPERLPSDAAAFRPVASLAPDALPPAFWLRVPLRSAAARQTQWVVPLSFDDVAAVLVHADGRKDLMRTGARVPRAEWTDRVGRPTGVRVALDAGEAAVLYLRVRHRAGGYADIVDPRPVEAEAFVAARRGRDVWGAMGLGIFVALAVYNLFLFGSFRDRSYLYYVGFLAGSVVYWSVTWGFVAEFVLPARLVLLPEVQLYAMVGSAIAYAQFVRHFLRTRRTAPRADTVLRGVIALWAASAIVGLAVSWPAGQQVAAAAALALIVATLTAGIVAWRAGFRPALAYLAAASPFLVIGTTFAVLFALDPANGDGALPWLQTAIVAEALGLALALVVRIRVLRSEREGAVVAREVAEMASVALREASDMKTHLLGITAHDLRSPLTTIAGAAEMIEHETPGRRDLHDLSDLIRRGAGRMLALIDDLLVTAALDGGQVRLHRTRLDVTVLAHEVVLDYGQPAADKGQTLVLHPCDDAVEATLDAERIRAVLDNLVSNAVKYTPLGGRIDVTCQSTSGEVRIAVSDTGPGLSPDDLAGLFQRFRRLTATPTAGETSTGLGLAIAHEFAVLHGGRIDAESALGDGTTFTLVLPAEVPEISEATLAAVG